MPARIDLTGQQFGKLIVLNYAFTENRRVIWNCRCLGCNQEVLIRAGNLLDGRSTQCQSCYFSRGKNFHEEEYAVWRKMKDRCLNDRAPDYNDYGRRGISIFSEWIEDFDKFYNYLESLSETRKQFELRTGEKATLDRINVNGNYEPGNLRWISRQEQAQNRRTNTLSERLVKYILWAKLIESKSVPLIFQELKNIGYIGSFGTVRDAYYRTTWTNINIDSEIKEYNTKVII